MRKLFLKAIFLLVFVGADAQSKQVINLGNNRELFVDQYLIENLSDVQQKMHHPRNEGPVLYFDKPWEGNFSAYNTIIKDGDLYRLYYRGIREAGSDGNDSEVTCYAESRDGINWIKPDLDIYTIGGTKKNNVILAHAAPVTHNLSPFLDKNPNAKASQRFKALGGTSPGGLKAYVSADGIHWNLLQDKSVITEGHFDSQNVAFWSESESKYVSYIRTGAKEGNKSYRSVSRATSTDFVNWDKPEPMKFGNVPYDHLYTQQTSPYYRAPHIYVAIGARFMPGRQVVSDEQAAVLNVNPQYYKDCSDAIFMTTRGGNHYDRTFLESFIRPGIGLENWVSRSNYPALNIVQTGEQEMSVYVGESYAQEGAHLKRYSMRIDGLVSLQAGMKEGSVITKPFKFEGKELEINYSTSAAGYVKVELLDVNGKSLPGFSKDDVTEIIGNEIKRVVTWKSNQSLSAISGKPVKLKFYLKDADLFSFKFN
ncbi:hypothetical protein [Agriterribacter sp.]|uniref:hypothetical protein n=1 Tax=Agriterribacter sp. TaxID=2821509 RepID=UPI002B8A6778|nr:hypothetical protein [Agriterribacter sp.]HRO46527.1 hypothetical protein [Agriterribacter sp.]HRQ17544.1 hypothetical protein [Agriterribacter sp.]